MENNIRSRQQGQIDENFPMPFVEDYELTTWMVKEYIDKKEKINTKWGETKSHWGNNTIGRLILGFAVIVLIVWISESLWPLLLLVALGLFETYSEKNIEKKWSKDLETLRSNRIEEYLAALERWEKEYGDYCHKLMLLKTPIYNPKYTQYHKRINISEWQKMFEFKLSASDIHILSSDADIVASELDECGKSLRFISKGTTIPLCPESAHLEIGERVKLDKIVLLAYCKNSEKDMLRVRIEE